MKHAIRVEGLSKRYRLGAQRTRSYRTLAETVAEGARSALDYVRRRPSRSESGRADFWALQDVSFDVHPGDTVGVIGRNGSGKSTLLKILSRIVDPTSGRAEVRGRMGSLLEVGTGFHPELSGRENIYLNGSILGMSRRDIDHQFDAIVAFSEVEQFLDTPVKRYSSGMYVRLAFAVAAHLEPEVLVVDEVLAVGDMGFQRKCLGKIGEVARAGRTVLFVSHNMVAVQSLCNRSVLLHGGRVVLQGTTREVVQEYHRRMNGVQRIGTTLSEIDGPDRATRVFQSAVLIDDKGAPTEVFPLGSAFRLRIVLHTAAAINKPTVGLGIDDADGRRVMSIHTPASRPLLDRLDGTCELECRIDPLPLPPGDYWVKFVLSTPTHAVDSLDRAMGFTVIDGDAFGEGRGFHRGVCVAPSTWTVVKGATP